MSASSWGASITHADGRYHIYASAITSVPNISEGLIYHGTARDVEGPYSYDPGPVGAAEGAEVVEQTFRNGTTRYVLWDSPDGRLGQFGSIRISDRPGGPFVDVPGGFPAQPKATCFDAAPLWVPEDETWYTVCQGFDAVTTARPVVIFSARRLRGPWGVFANSSAWRPAGQWLEDPFLWRDSKRNWHLLQHAFDLNDTQHCLSSTVSAHAFSPDGKEWHTVAPYVAPYGHSFARQDGSTAKFSTCERPKLIIDAKRKAPTHMIFAVDAATKDEGCRHREGDACEPHGTVPGSQCGCVNCKWGDRGDTIIVQLES